jgi:hypothetical protein
MSCADAMATPASNAAVLSNSCFLMESFLLFTVPRAGPNALRFTGKRISRACSSDRRGDSLRRVAARSRRFQWNRMRESFLANYAVQLCEIRAAVPANVGGAHRKFHGPRCDHEAESEACLGEPRQSSLRGETRLLVGFRFLVPNPFPAVRLSPRGVRSPWRSSASRPWNSGRSSARRWCAPLPRAVANAPGH